MENRYYTYVLIDPRTSQPFYVGKGCNNRCKVHEYDAMSKKDGTYIHNQPLHQFIRHLVAEGQKPIIEKVSFGVTSAMALKKEKELVKLYGRKVDGRGLLLNLSRGGQAGGETCKAVVQYNKDGIYINQFESARLAAEQVAGANASYISQCCQGKRVSSGGFLWSYKGEKPQEYTKKYWRAVKQYSIDGAQIAEYKSLSEAERVTGVEKHNISEACRGNSKTAGGFVWMYAE